MQAPGARCQVPDAIPGSAILEMCEVAPVLTFRLYGVLIFHARSGFFVIRILLCRIRLHPVPPVMEKPGITGKSDFAATVNTLLSGMQSGHTWRTVPDALFNCHGVL